MAITVSFFEFLPQVKLYLVRCPSPRPLPSRPADLPYLLISEGEENTTSLPFTFTTGGPAGQLGSTHPHHTHRRQHPEAIRNSTFHGAPFIQQQDHRTTPTTQ